MKFTSNVVNLLKSGPTIEIVNGQVDPTHDDPSQRMPCAKMRVGRRDVIFVAAGAFSALCFVYLTNRGLRPVNPIAQHIMDFPATTPPKKDSGPFEDWYGEPVFDDHEPSRDPVTNEDGSGNAPRETFEPVSKSLLSTKVLNHAAGWTMFENLYMSNGTLFIVTAPEDEPSPLGFENGAPKEGWVNGFPPRRMMTSTGLYGYATPESVQEREPSDKDMSFISTQEAKRRWGNHVWEISGHTWLFNDPNQFLGHFYHFVAESLFGIWAFYAGTLDPSITAMGETTAHIHPERSFFDGNPSDFRDSSKFNTFYMKAAFPSMTLETSSDWTDRIFMTRNGDKAWRFSNAVLADRSASFRSDLVGAKVQRIAAEALKAVETHMSRWWWEPIRRAVLRVANVPEEVINMAVTSTASFDSHLSIENKLSRKDWPVVITYINRQGGRRCLIEEDHERLVAVLGALAHRRGWEFHDIKAQHLSQEEQLAIASRTTIMVGVHGNGLSHLLSIAPTRLSTVVEIFYMSGFMHDYEWTARALGHQYYGVWNDTTFQYPDLPGVGTPEGFQGNAIPVYAPTISQLIESRVDSVHASIDTSQ